MYVKKALSLDALLPRARLWHKILTSHEVHGNSIQTSRSYYLDFSINKVVIIMIIGREGV